MKPERRTVHERLGSSLNASVLRTEGRSPNVETPLTHVAALGAAALHIHHGVTRKDAELAAVVAAPEHKPDPRDVVAAHLASALVHVRYARQYAGLPNTVGLFAQWMGFKVRFKVIEDRAVLLPRLSARVLHEWLSDRCGRCGGSGRLEVTGSGILVRGQGRMQRNAQFRACPVHQGCGGTGRPPISHTGRRLALEISRERYDVERWGAHCSAALAWLDSEIWRLAKPLTAQLEWSKKRV